MTINCKARRCRPPTRRLPHCCPTTNRLFRRPAHTRAVPEEKTPPKGNAKPDRLVPRPDPLPTLPVIYNLLAGLAGQVGGLRDDVDAAVGKIDGLHERLEPPSEPPPSMIQIPDEPLEPVVVARPSMPARAAAAVKTGGSKTGGWALKISGGLMILAQLISWATRPENGPIVQSLRIIASALARQPAPPPSELPPPEWTPLPDPESKP
jgi:hypothetical protein